MKILNTSPQALHALNSGKIYEAYELFLSAGSYNLAHDLAVLELAPDAILRRDFELLKSLFTRFVGRPVEGWHLHGKVGFTFEISPVFLLTELGLSGLRADYDPLTRIA